MRRVTRCLLVGLVFAPVRVTLAQDTVVVGISAPPKPVADTLRCGFCHRPNLPVALFEGFLVNGTVNRFNAWVLRDSSAKVNPDSWRSNLKNGWSWDKDDFVVNMLGHPYNGSAYFSAARSNGLSYWAGVPLTFFHSAVWEYFGETNPPSINDLVDTGLGGSALGEMFYRVAATIRNNEIGGKPRVLRELAALPFDPVGSVNRLLGGEWGRTAPNPSEHNPVATVLQAGGGAGIVRGPGSLLSSLKGAKFSSILFADLKYGDSYVDSLRKPFDAFSARILLAPGHGGLTQLVGVGRVTGKELGRTEWHRHQLELNQRFEYLNNGAYEFGAQTLELGVSSRVHLWGKFWFRSLIAGDGIVLAGINAPGAGLGPRDYDFGPGLGGTFTAALEHDGVPHLTFHYQPAWVHTVNGADANHLTSFGSVETSIPILDQIVVVIQGSYYTRTSRYADGTRNTRNFPEIRLFTAFKTANRPAAPQVSVRTPNLP